MQRGGGGWRSVSSRLQCDSLPMRCGDGATRVCARSPLQGVSHVYVHVAADNVAAVELYRGPGGFVLEQEESEGNARVLGRPRRLLLVRSLSSDS